MFSFDSYKTGLVELTLMDFNQTSTMFGASSEISILLNKFILKMA